MIWKNNSLSIVLFLITVVLIGAMFLTGWQVYDRELAEHGRLAIGAADYLTSGHFLSTMFENWESEFLEKAAYVVFTAFLIQRGSPESRDPDEPQDQDNDAPGSNPASPWPVRSGKLVRWLYSYSLGIVLMLIFVGTILLHLTSSREKANMEAELHGQPQVVIGSTSAKRSSGSSPSRNGSPNSCPPAPSSFCRSSCGFEVRLNRSLSLRRTQRQASRLKAETETVRLSPRSPVQRCFSL